MQLSLVNLVLAGAIIALIAVVVLPLAEGLGGAVQLEQAAMQLAMDLQRAQQLAVASGSSVEFTFARYQNYYLIKHFDGPTPDIHRVDLPPGVAWRHLSFDQLLWYPSGRVSRNGTIRLANKDEAEISIVIAPHSGRVRVLRQGEN